MRSQLTKAAMWIGRTSRFERLEDRMLLAGNVTAACSKGNLTITGDKCDNQICVKQIDSCKWEIRGECGTTINGCDCWIATCVTGCVSIDCKKGCDSIKVKDGTICQGLSICDSSGNTSIWCSNLCVGGLSVKTDGGSDCCVVTDCDISCDSKCDGKKCSNGVKWDTCCIDTGKGCDEVLCSDICGARCTIDVKCGDGADDCALTDCHVQKICCDVGKDCDKVCVTKCSADSCETKGDKHCVVDCSDNCFKKDKCSAPRGCDVDKCIQEICDSREWCDLGCELSSAPV